MSNLTSTLNDRQLEAVTTGNENSLVIAGAGSGKTKVLIHRIAYILENFPVSTFNILAVTFTNKAANEMKERVEGMLNTAIGGMWIGTFHGLCHRMLRQHFNEANLPEDFQIIDQDDQNKIIKKIHIVMGLDETKWPPKKSVSYINSKKENGLESKDIIVENNPTESVLLSVYKNYESQCRISGLIDFSDLLLKTYKMLMAHDFLRHSYRDRFKFILVDEFQDINNIQYLWLKCIAGIVDSNKETNAVMVVGDDDQSIYSWRGAEIAHILSFSKEFPAVKTIRLEQNYRSTGNILEAANAVIAKNDGRLGKSLWTSGERGAPIYLYHSSNDIDEATFIANQILAWQQNGRSTKEVAVLYRSNAQSRIIEEIFNRNQIAYRIYGGLRFFDRAEIKDALSYMRIVANQDDNAAFDRVINQPARGIGKQTLQNIRDHANSQGISLYKAAQQMTSNSSLSARACSAVIGFLDLITSIRNEIEDKSLGEAASIIIERSKLPEFYLQDKKEQGQTKLENLEELVNAAQIYKNPDIGEQNDNPSLSEFLAHSILATDTRESNKNNPNAVDLMTLHSAKGLEYSLVFLAGLEEGLFPHKMSILDGNRLEEERRLCYVGITRAREKLCITHAATRRLHGSESYQTASRFLYEIPPALIQEIKAKGYNEQQRRSENTWSKSKYESHDDRNYSKPKRVTDNGNDSNCYRLGQRVSHAKFGSGVVLNYEGDKNNGRVQIKFKNHGSK
ncbi:MAG: UvrD-helicase domain-containing protein, partial [Pseudomonadota bacterium]|nr:UvrD-helicase domain-containing protein [Pseudomonadota bacterium]